MRLFSSSILHFCCTLFYPQHFQAINIFPFGGHKGSVSEDPGTLLVDGVLNEVCFFCFSSKVETMFEILTSQIIL